MINRALVNKIEGSFFKGKAVILYGPRQVGKTTLINSILDSYQGSVMRLNGDESDVKDLLSMPTSAKLRNLTAGNKIIFIDEAQKIPGIGTAIKLFTDNIPEVQVVATGSSSFELADKTSEPLTGRKYEFLLLPLMFSELSDSTSVLDEKRVLEQRMIYGSYPEIVSKPAEAKNLLKMLAASYLYKDIFNLDRIRNSLLIERIVKALALQIGNEVSYMELARLTGADKNTVEKYIEVLEKTFIIFRLPGYNANVRTEIRKGKKFYFYDNGIRNAVIGNFNPMSSRTDAGALWENYAVSERIKKLLLNSEDAFSYFWRTTLQQEIDYIEERQGTYHAYEIKYGKTAHVKFPSTFMENYNVKTTMAVRPSNIEDFLL